MGFYCTSLTSLKAAKYPSRKSHRRSTDFVDYYEKNALRTAPGCFGAGTAGVRAVKNFLVIVKRFDCYMTSTMRTVRPMSIEVPVAINHRKLIARQ